MNNPVDTQSTDSPVCPHCFHVHKDSHEWRPGDWEVYKARWECEACNGLFIWSRRISVTHTTEKADLK